MEIIERYPTSRVREDGKRNYGSHGTNRMEDLNLRTTGKGTDRHPSRNISLVGDAGGTRVHRSMDSLPPRCQVPFG